MSTNLLQAVHAGVALTEGVGHKTADPLPSGLKAFHRPHASDRVFRALAGAILNRQLLPNAALPPERELSERFGVSRFIVREAVHRLKEHQLVRVLQGKLSLVLDHRRSTDTRLLGLEIDLMSSSSDVRAEFEERQVYSAAAMLDLAEQRMDRGELNLLDELTKKFGRPDTSREYSREIEAAYWTLVAKASRNRLYVRSTLWYLKLLEQRPEFHNVFDRLPVDRHTFYECLNRALRAREGAAAVYLEVVRRRGATPA